MDSMALVPGMKYREGPRVVPSARRLESGIRCVEHRILRMRQGYVGRGCRRLSAVTGLNVEAGDDQAEETDCDVGIPFGSLVLTRRTSSALSGCGLLPVLSACWGWRQPVRPISPCISERSYLGSALIVGPYADPETVVANGLNRHDSDVTSVRADPCAVPAPDFRDLNVLRAPLAERRS